MFLPIVQKLVRANAWPLLTLMGRISEIFLDENSYLHRPLVGTARGWKNLTSRWHCIGTPVGNPRHRGRPLPPQFLRPQQWRL